MNNQVSKIDLKEKILLATLEVIKAKGMRGVRHRAVALQAGVSLGSTTYHFKSIEDLISSTFVYWHHKIAVGHNPHFIALEKNIENFVDKNISSALLAESLLLGGETYLRNQIFDNSDDRKIELAFHNEALRNSTLSKLLLSSWQKEVNIIFKLYEALGNISAYEDAEITFALILQLEKKAMLIHDKQDLELEFKSMMNTLKRHIFLVVGN